MYKQYFNRLKSIKNNIINRTKQWTSVDALEEVPVKLDTFVKQITLPELTENLPDIVRVDGMVFRYSVADGLYKADGFSYDEFDDIIPSYIFQITKKNTEVPFIVNLMYLKEHIGLLVQIEQLFTHLFSFNLCDPGDVLDRYGRDIWLYFSGSGDIYISFGSTQKLHKQGKVIPSFPRNFIKFNKSSGGSFADLVFVEKLEGEAITKPEFINAHETEFIQFVVNNGDTYEVGLLGRDSNGNFMPMATGYVSMGTKLYPASKVSIQYIEAKWSLISHSSMFGNTTLCHGVGGDINRIPLQWKFIENLPTEMLSELSVIESPVSLKAVEVTNIVDITNVGDDIVMTTDNQNLSSLLDGALIQIVTGDFIGFVDFEEMLDLDHYDFKKFTIDGNIITFSKADILRNNDYNWQVNPVINIHILNSDIVFIVDITQKPTLSLPDAIEIDGHLLLYVNNNYIEYVAGKVGVYGVNYGIYVDKHHIGIKTPNGIYGNYLTSVNNIDLMDRLPTEYYYTGEEPGLKDSSLVITESEHPSFDFDGDLKICFGNVSSNGVLTSFAPLYKVGPKQYLFNSKSGGIALQYSEEKKAWLILGTFFNFVGDGDVPDFVLGSLFYGGGLNVYICDEWTEDDEQAIIDIITNEGSFLDVPVESVDDLKRINTVGLVEGIPFSPDDTILYKECVCIPLSTIDANLFLFIDLAENKIRDSYTIIGNIHEGNLLWLRDIEDFFAIAGGDLPESAVLTEMFPPHFPKFDPDGFRYRVTANQVLHYGDNFEMAMLVYTPTYVTVLILFKFRYINNTYLVETWKYDLEIFSGEDVNGELIEFLPMKLMYSDGYYRLMVMLPEISLLFAYVKAPNSKVIPRSGWIPGVNAFNLLSLVIMNIKVL